MGTRWTGIGLAIGAACAMGGAAPALKTLGGAGGLSAINIIQARTAVGALALLACTLVLRQGRMRVHPRDWWLIAMYGGVSIAANQVVFTMSLSRLPVGVALLLEYLAPVLVAGWVRLVRRQPVSGLVWVGAATTVLGLGLLGKVWSGFALDGLGVGLGLLAAVTLAGRFLVVERGLRRYDPLVMAAWGTAAAAVATSAVAALAAGAAAPFPVHVLTERVTLSGAVVPVFVLVAWVGLVGMAGGVLLGVTAQRLLPPTTASLLLSLEVVAGSVLAYALLGERLTGVQAAGAAIMLAGVLAVAAAKRAPAKPAVVGPAFDKRRALTHSGHQT
ncbi:EamA family transporter [Pseudonocardia eucalypti]|uniref:EamA family transporter n=1 Tax=Pseudonocardia eucalypti TaxID=648755 RepID=A0ABP9PFD2_9PSEU|nr:drug/metabolite transporter (DMT)-like permease [Pseudonocardia eucalypti]